MFDKWFISTVNKCRLYYSRFTVIRTSTRNLLQITKISNNWKSTYFKKKWPISNYYQFFTELGHKKDVELCNKMLHKSFPCKITNSLKFFKKIVYWFLFLRSVCQNSLIWDLVIVIFRIHYYQKETSIQVTLLHVLYLIILAFLAFG